MRREFDSLRHLAPVVHLHHAYQVEPDGPSRDHLLDAIDRRNAFIASLYDARGRAVADGGWAHVLFPFAGHDANHLRLAPAFFHTTFGFIVRCLWMNTYGANHRDRRPGGVG